MSLELIVSLALRILVLAGIGGCIAAIRQNASASERHLLWMLTLAAIIVLPIAAALLPRLDLITLPAVSSGASPEVSPGLPEASLLPALIATAWLAGSLLCSLGLLIAHARVRRIVRTSSLDCDLSQAIGIPVLVSGDAGFAFNYGLSVPVIVLPARSITWSAELLRATLIHEVAHVARRDGVSLLISQLAQVAYWWHPAVRYIVREAASERECACDDAVLRVGVRATVYGGHLLANATPRLNDSVAVAAPLFSRTDGLLPRIARLLDDRVDHGVARRTAVYSAVAAAFPLLAFVASATPVARHVPVPAAIVLAPPVLARAPVTAPNALVLDSVHKKRERSAERNASSRRPRKRPVSPDTMTAVSGNVMQSDFAGAATFPVDLKKFARLAGDMGRLAAQMANSVDSAKLGVTR